MNNLVVLSETDYGSMMIKGVFSYQLFGQTLWITTTHIAVAVILLLIIVLAVIAHHKLTKHPDEVPGTFQNILELIVEKLDGLVEGSMGAFASRGFKNYIGAIFIFIILCNLGGILGLRTPTSDYGVTLPLGLFTFVLIQFNGFRVKKFGHLKALAEPYPFLLPSNIIGEVSVPVSLSLRLFGNMLSGTMIMALWYAMMPWLAKIVISPFLHAYMDVFSGCIQTYVFCMLTMTYLMDKME